MTDPGLSVLKIKKNNFEKNAPTLFRVGWWARGLSLLENKISYEKQFVKLDPVFKITPLRLYPVQSRNLLNYFSILFISIFLSHCVLFQRSVKIKPLDFDYSSISKNYFSPVNEKPFPLTVQRGNNLYNSTTADGNYLFYTTDQNGNYDIWFRDLKSSIIVPVTRHPSAEYKPAISPDGKKLVFVSEEFDSEGDIVLLNMNPGEWVQEVLRGNRFISEDFQLLTNPDYKKPGGKKERNADTDPAWSPDGRYIVFSSERFSPGIQNLVILDLKNKNQMRQVTRDGGASPFWSYDGKTIVYLSFSDNEYGEIYRLDVQTGKQERLTNNKFMDFSPSLSMDGKTLFYTSIRQDTSQNGKLDERDNSYIVRVDLAKNDEKLLSSGKTSLFDTRFSTFNGGSILFAASLFNSINIYFIPISGSTPRQDTIQSQFEFALRYREKQSYESFLLALDSVRLFFENDPLYPVFESEVDNVKVEEAERIRRRRDADYFLEKMDKTRNDPRFGLSYAYSYSLKSKRINRNPVPHLQEYYNSLKTSKAERQSLASVLNLIADEEEDQGNDKVAIRHYESLIREYPDYYDIQYVKRRIGKLSFNKDSIVIPDQYIEIANSASPDKEEMRNTLLDIEEKITGGRNYEQKLKLVDSIIDGNKLKDKSRVLNNLFLFIKAGALSENNKFQESNELIDSFLPAVPVSNPLFLKSHLLKSKNFENMGSVSGSFDELRFYLENYDPALGVDLQEAEIEKSFRYYENKAAEHEKRGNLQEAALHYFFNTENMYLLKSKNLFLNSLYKTYAIYYQRKMVESIFQFGRKLAADESKGVLGTIGKGGSEVVSNVTNVLSSATDNKVFNNLKFLGDFKDLRNFNILGPDALRMIDLHFKQGLPRARPVLYLASLYGYAYYLINKSVIYENFYYENGAMTESRKSAILEDFKRAEYELRWIIFADPQFSDAYQLLGWLYQYIDIVKSSKSNPDGIPEGEYYSAAYLKYFPEKNFEINVEYYRQILDFLGESPNKKILSDLNLNLANNYFLLNNYPRAKDHYQATGKLSKFIVEKTQFENYKQAALYHFNFARTSIYIADYAKAIEELDIAAKIYYKNEYYPYLAKVGYDPENKSPFKQALLETKNKLALIFALSGLSAMESEQYSKSISFVNKALTMNKDSNYIENINLYNALAICHQKLGRYATSNYFAKKVEKEYSRKGKNFIQKFASFSIWNSLMPDSVRVIGEGRFPGSFPPEYHNLLSRGIRISNLRDENEFTLQSKAIVRREAFIKSNDLIQTNAGTRILNGTIPELAYVEYLKGNYPESQEKYYSAFEFFKKGGLPQEAKKYLIRSGNILFRGIEDQQEKTGNEIEKIKKYISILLREKSEIISECQVRAAADSKIPPDAFELNKSCEEQFFKDWYNFEPALGLSYYYLAEEYLSVNNREGATHYLGLSIPLLKNPSGIPDDLIGISGDVFSKKERIRLLTNLSIVFLQLNDAENFNKISADAADLALEFQQMEELSRIKYLQAKFIHNSSDDKSRYEKALRLLKESEDILTDNLDLLLGINKRFIQNLYDLKIILEAGSGNPGNAFYYKDKLLNLTLFRSIIGNRIFFEDKKLDKAYKSLTELVAKDGRLGKQIGNLAMERKSIVESAGSKENLEKSIKEKLLKIRSEFPDKKDFFDPRAESEIEIKVNSDEIVYRLLDAGRFLIIAKITGQKKEILQLKKTTEDLRIVLQNFFEKELTGVTGKKIIFIPDKSFFSFDLNTLSVRGKTLPEQFDILYAFKASQVNFMEKSRNIKAKNIAGIHPDSIPSIDDISPDYKRYRGNKLGTFIYEPDIVDCSLSYDNSTNFFGESKNDHLNLKEIFQRRSRISSAIINNWSDNVRDYERSVFAIDVLRSAGVSNIFFVGKENANRELRRKLIGSRNNRTRSRDPGNIRTITMQKSGKPDSISTTELVYKKMIDQAVKAERRTDYSIALENYYAAFALIPDKADLAFKTELNIARIKTKIFRKKFPEFYDAILKKYANDPEKKKQIVYSLLRFCYTDPKENDCEKYYDQFISSQQSGETRSINSINFYRDLKNGDLKSVNSGYPAFLSQNSGEDVYLFHITLARMFLENHLLAKAETSALRALNESSSDEENLRAKQMLSAVRLQHLFLGGLGSISINSASADVIFSSGIAKDWQKFDAELKTNLIDDENVSGTERTNYRIKLYNSWKKIETGGDPTPLFLNPDDLPGGRSVLNYLGIVDRSLLFFVLQKSIPFQVDSELNNIFDRIYSREMNLKNIYRAQNLAIVWASALFESGDYAASKKYISIIEKNFDRNIDSQNTTRFYFLKFRYSQMNKDLKLTDEELAYLRKNIPAKIALYDTAKKTDVRKLIEFLNANISKEKEAILEPYLKRELLDFVTYLQALSFKANNSEVFFDLAIAKDKIRSVTEKVFGEKITFSRIPEFRTISYELLKKLPDKQAFLAVLDYGHQTFFIKFSNGKSNGDLAFKDNRSVIDSVLEYHRLVKENGNAILQKETLEDRYRKAIRIDKNRLTYLYLSGIHLKAPLEHREEDNFYLVQSPEEMLKRDPYKISSDLDKNFALTQKLRTTYNPDWFRKLKKLENMELGGRTGGVQTSKAVVSQEELILKDRRKLEFAGIDLKDVSTLDKRQGNWFLSSSLLYESSFFSNDINTSLMYLDKIHSGPGVISIGSQRDLNNVYFLKNLFRKSDVRIALKDRFIDSIREVRKLFPDENHWNGYRLYTNVFLVE